MNAHGLRRSCVLLMIALVTACSGGGGGGGTGAAAVNPPPLLLITTNNAFDIASTVVQGVLAGFDSAAAGSGPVGGAPPAMPARVTESETGPVARALQAAVANGGMLMLEVAVGPVTQNCSLSGLVTVSGNLINPGTPTVGDTLIMQFSQCDDGLGIVMDGRADVEITAYAGNLLTDVYRLGMDTRFANLRMTSGGEVATASGNVNIVLDSLGFPVFVNEVAGSFFEIAVNNEGYSLFNFFQSLEVDTGIVPEPLALIADGTLASQLLDGSVDFNTITVIRATGDADPDSGAMLITGTAGSAVTIVIQSGGGVRLDIDTDGDGVVDDTQFTSWAALTDRT